MPAEMSEAELPLHRLSEASSRASQSSAAVGDGLPPTASSLPIRTDAYADDAAETGDADADAAAALLDSSDTEKRPAGARGRARTASFSFDFSGRLLQLAASDEVGAGTAGGTAADRGTREGRGGKVKEHMSLIGGMALIVGIVIGSGIFSSPGVVARETGSVGSALLVWAGAGLLSWAGVFHTRRALPPATETLTFTRRRRIQFRRIGSDVTQ